MLHCRGSAQKQSWTSPFHIYKFYKLNLLTLVTLAPIPLRIFPQTKTGVHPPLWLVVCSWSGSTLSSAGCALWSLLVLLLQAELSAGLISRVDHKISDQGILS